MIADAVLIGWLSRKTAHISFHVFKGKAAPFALAILILLVPIAAAALTRDSHIWSFLLVAVSIALYSRLAWKTFLGSDERLWIAHKFRTMFGG